MIDLGRDICCNLSASSAREWLVTNGIGGYASGTVAGVLTRRYHGLLIAALKPPLGRTLLLTKLDESAAYLGRAYLLYANCLADDCTTPGGFRRIEHFHLEGATPVWQFACADALLEKRLWMQPEANTTYIRYTLQRASAPMRLSLQALVNYRDHHANTHAQDWQMRIEPVENGLRITATRQATPFYLLSDMAQATPHHQWQYDYFLSIEKDRGYDELDDNLLAGMFEATLQPGQTLTLIASAEPTPNMDAASVCAQCQAREQILIERAGLSAAPLAIQHLALAADQFIVRRNLPNAAQGHTVIAGYHWFSDWGRDTMISLPGLTLAAGRPELAASILRTFARFVNQGMLPNRFPDAGEQPEYNTVDATLWYFEAIRAYLEATDDEALLRELFPVLQEIIAWHQRGTRYQIHLDTDGLLYAGEPGVQLTWMDAKVGDWVVTPRIGKPVEINALWFNALRVMANLARRLGQPAEGYEQMAQQACAGLARFWNESAGYCFDVLDGPEGNDASLRPNQLLAVSLPHSPLTPAQQRAVVDACARELLTSYGLRSLSPDDAAFIGHYGGALRKRDAAYHQGTVWGWLIGPFVSAHLRVYGDRQAARSFLQPLIQHLADYGLGSLAEIFDGDAPFAPRGCIAQAWSVAEALRLYKVLFPV